MNQVSKFQYIVIIEQLKVMIILILGTCVNLIDFSYLTHFDYILKTTLKIIKFVERCKKEFYEKSQNFRKVPYIFRNI